MFFDIWTDYNFFLNSHPRWKWYIWYETTDNKYKFYILQDRFSNYCLSTQNTPIRTQNTLYVMAPKICNMRPFRTYFVDFDIIWRFMTKSSWSFVIIVSNIISTTILNHFQLSKSLRYHLPMLTHQRYLFTLLNVTQNKKETNDSEFYRQSFPKMQTNITARNK